MKLKDIGEFGFIERIAAQGIVRTHGVVKAIGDDCAVVSLEGPDYLLITTDMLVERVHFVADWSGPDVLGAKSLATNISDIAACGGRPLDAFVSLAIPERIEVEWLDLFYSGMRDLGRDFGVNILGGDTTRSKVDLVINVAVTGTVPRDQVLFRHTARPGDLIVLTGPTGESGAGCEILSGSTRIPADIADRLINAHLRPRPHVREGRKLAESRACTAAIDVSDGLSSDLGHICRESGLAAIVYEERLPISDALVEAAAILGKDPLEWVLHGGEDYVLLAAVSPEEWTALEDQVKQEGMSFHCIGKLLPGVEMELERVDGSRQILARKGWNHFR